MHINTKSLVATYVVIELFFYVLFQGCGSNYFYCHRMSVENCNSTTCLILPDVHLCVSDKEMVISRLLNELVKWV